MKKGNITQLLDYYMSPDNLWMFRAEVDRAVKDFFEGKIPRPLPDDAAGHFNEWFLYDFRLSNGESPLEYFCSKNPLRLDPEEFSEYESMKENIYSFWEVKDVRKNKGLTLLDVRSGEEYEISEKAATLEMQKGDAIVCRIVKVRDHWEIAGGSSFRLPGSDKNTRGFLKEFKNIPGKINPMIVYQVFVKKQPEQNFKKDKITDNESSILVSGGYGDGDFEEDDDCAVCRLMRKTREEGRQPTKEEILRATEEANKERG